MAIGGRQAFYTPLCGIAGKCRRVASRLDRHSYWPRPSCIH